MAGPWEKYAQPQAAPWEKYARNAPAGPSPEMVSGLAEASSMSRPAAPPRENTVAGVAGQFGAGSQSGIASALGFPVDAVTGAINGIGQMTGMYDPIQNPVGGSSSIDAMLQPFRAGIPEPQTATERASRRIGQEVGASAAMLPAAFAAPAVRAAPATSAAVEGASALGAGTGAAIANEIAPGNPYADIIGGLGGGLLSGSLASRVGGLNGTPAAVRDGITEQRDIASDAYGAVRSDMRVLPQDSVDNMALGISGKMDAERLNPRLQPGSAAILDALLTDSSGPMRIEDIENLRRMTSQNLPVNATPADRRLAGIMTSEITDYLDNLDDPVADALKSGRTAYRRASAATAVSEATDKASRRASRTGTGGNEINATRQNLSALIENPRKSRSFTPDELAAMDGVVRGTDAQNALRRLSRFAPSSGGLSSMLGIGGAMASPAIALPIMAATEGAKALGEVSTKKSIAALLQKLAPDRVTKASERGAADIVRALLAARTVSQDR